VYMYNNKHLLKVGGLENGVNISVKIDVECRVPGWITM
jgi:hypothetical protein